MKRWSLLIVPTLLIALAGPLAAQDKYPSKPIKIIVPYAPGGGTDITARIVAEEMKKTLGQPILIENKPGANGLIGLEELMREKPDGYSMILANQTVAVISPMLYPKRMTLNPEKDLRPITRVAEIPNVFVVNKDFPAKTFAEFIEYAKKNPDKVSYTSTGVGSFPHFDLEILARRADIKIVHLPNAKGASASVNDLATGDAQVGLVNAATSGPLVRSGNVRALAVAFDKRLPDYPDVPTLAEAGFPGVGTVQWFAFLTHANAPDEAVKTLHDAAASALKSKPVLEAFEKQRIASTPSPSPDEAKQFVTKEYEHWRKVFQEVPIEIER
ncbi:MAG TPA: tripartite tricarboxylate transporter substrate binding protein [Xanthobacteraceae bacterium]|nr:tripartite tricarboxylate transporter substrate binding protein [Xanthobacteraceae bacterium]